LSGVDFREMFLIFLFLENENVLVSGDCGAVSEATGASRLPHS